MKHELDLYSETFRAELDIDKDKLDDECLKNPSLNQFVGEMQVKAKVEVLNLENQLKAKQAEFNLYVRENPPTNIKITESVVESLIEINPDIIEIRNQIVLAREKLLYLDVTMSTIEDRKGELKNLVTLWLGGYFGEVKLDGINKRIFSERA
jgi:hypothetical protein